MSSSEARFAAALVQGIAITAAVIVYLLGLGLCRAAVFALVAGVIFCSAAFAVALCALTHAACTALGALCMVGAILGGACFRVLFALLQGVVALTACLLLLPCAAVVGCSAARADVSPAARRVVLRGVRQALGALAAVGAASLPAELLGLLSAWHLYAPPLLLLCAATLCGVGGDLAMLCVWGAPVPLFYGAAAALSPEGQRVGEEGEEGPLMPVPVRTLGALADSIDIMFAAPWAYAFKACRQRLYATAFALQWALSMARALALTAPLLAPGRRERALAAPLSGALALASLAGALAPLHFANAAAGAGGCANRAAERAAAVGGPLFLRAHAFLRRCRGGGGVDAAAAAAPPTAPPPPTLTPSPAEGGGAPEAPPPRSPPAAPPPTVALTVAAAADAWEGAAPSWLHRLHFQQQGTEGAPPAPHTWASWCGLFLWPRSFLYGRRGPRTRLAARRLLALPNAGSAGALPPPPSQQQQQQQRSLLSAIGHTLSQCAEMGALSGEAALAALVAVARGGALGSRLFAVPPATDMPWPDALFAERYDLPPWARGRWEGFGADEGGASGGDGERGALLPGGGEDGGAASPVTPAFRRPAECAICAEGGPAVQPLLRLHGGAYFCGECLRKHAEGEMHKGSLPVPCPCNATCPRRLELTYDYFAAQALLDVNSLRRLLTLELRLQGFRVLKCPSCGLPFDAGGAGGGFAGVNRVVRCPYGGGAGACDARICFECGASAHHGRACGAPPDAPPLSAADKAALGIKPCPACGALVQKAGGCSAMVCGRNYHSGGAAVGGCGANFCWDCGGVQPAGRLSIVHNDGCPYG